MYKLSEAFPKQQRDSVIADDKVALNRKWPLDANKSRVRGTLSASDHKVTRIRGKRCCSLIAGDKVYLYTKCMAIAMI